MISKDCKTLFLDERDLTEGLQKEKALQMGKLKIDEVEVHHFPQNIKMHIITHDVVIFRFHGVYKIIKSRY